MKEVREWGSACMGKWEHVGSSRIGKSSMGKCKKGGSPIIGKCEYEEVRIWSSEYGELQECG